MINPLEFPLLAAEGYAEKSPLSPKYNCIAWAAGESHRWWSPQVQYYWPPGVPRANSIDAYVQAFGTVGFVECDDNERFAPTYEADHVRIALYASSGVPKHAARQISARLWTSKLGRNVDIEHTIRGLEGPTYGTVRKILKKPIKAS